MKSNRINADDDEFELDNESLSNSLIEFREDVKNFEVEEEESPTEIESDLMGDEKMWYKRVMKWTKQNRRGYLTIKSIQTGISLLLFGICLILYFNYWKKSFPDDPLMVTMRLIIAMLAVDIATFLCDFIMILKRWAFFISLRFIFCSASVTLSAIVLVHFFSEEYKNNEIEVKFSRKVELWISFIILYIFQSYIVWGILNVFMYFQILEMEKHEKYEMKAMEKAK